MRRRRNFTLLEVLIAMALIGLTLGPLLYPHFATLRDERAFAREIRLDILANCLHADLLEKMYEGNFDWTQMTNEKGVGLLDVESDALHRMGYTGKWDVWTVKSKPKDAPTVFLVQMDLHVTRKRETKEQIFTYHTVVRRATGELEGDALQEQVDESSGETDVEGGVE